MFREDPNPTVTTATRPDVRPEVVDELQILEPARVDRAVDDLAIFGLTRTNQERRRRKSRVF